MTTAAPAARRPKGPRGTAARQALRYAILPIRVLVLLPAMIVGRTLLRKRGAGTEPEVLVWNEADRLWEPAHTEIELSVIMPFYNPGDALAPTVARAHEQLTAAGVGFEIIAVSDGSTDGSEKTLEGMPPEVKVIVLPANRGKGGALHAGFARASGSWIGFVDSDGDIDPAHLVEYVRVARRGGYDIVFANKKHGESESASSPLRKIVSFGFSSIVGTLFSLGVNDTQTGCKVVRRDVMANLLPRLRETRFAFDLELFVSAVTAGYTNLHAEPVRLEERMSGSTVTSKTILRTLTDALSVLARRHYTDVYSTAPEGSPLARTESPLTLAA
ncbi:MAG: glycosyltransferase family 2 protein [Actinobacteria bacterium]|jgi:hypothetical protein|nr:glycosyltransferase family 2 protein [Actinomycetota bacterium]